MKPNKIHLNTAAVFLFSSVIELQAAGFYLKEQSIVSQGQAFAGVAAQSGLASSTYFNPAGLATLEQSTVEGGVHLILTDQKVSDAGSTSTGVPSLGNSNVAQQQPLDSVIAVPNFYWAKPIGDYVLGVGVNAPFGSKNEYHENYFGRFDHISADMKTVDLTFAVGQQVNDRLRVGGALYYQMLDVEQKKATGTTQVGILKGDSGSVGFSAGMQYSIADTDFGLSYRSGTTQDLTGTNTIVGTQGGGLPAGTYAT